MLVASSNLINDTTVTKNLTHDTAYFTSYSDHIVGRLYFSQKFTRLAIENDTSDFAFEYLPNTSLNLGVGFTYEWITLNLAYGFGFLNKDEGKGKTKYLDLQFHSYGSKLMLDVLAQFYQGFYVQTLKQGATKSEFYQRPDLNVYELGASAQWVFNNKKFSYRSSFMQNEWQKKSAGSFLLGAEAYIGDVGAEKGIIPPEIDSIAAEKEYTKMNFIELGPNVGYAHTFVIKKHFFLHASLSLGLTVGSTTYKNFEGNTTETGLSPNSSFKIAAGYNSEKWVLNLLFVNTQVEVNRARSPQSVGIETGNFRIIYAKRFMPGNKLQRKLKKLPGI
jgi:hypothetical protein